jgi:hypothetical protein
MCASVNRRSFVATIAALVPASALLRPTVLMASGRHSKADAGFAKTSRLLRYGLLSVAARVLPFLTLGCMFGVQLCLAQEPDFHLQVVPGIVYKVDDPGGSRTSSFVFDIAVLCSKDCDLTPISGRAELASVGSIVERQDWTPEMLAKIKRTSFRIEPNTPLMAPVRAVALPEAFELRFYFRESQALAIDSLALRLTLADAKGRRAEQTLGIPVRYYQQKTVLIFPIRGNGIIGQDYVTSGGHGGHGVFE